MKNPKIDVRIPFEPGGQLGADYNRIMKETLYDWILFLDHDVILSVNPHWYYISQKTIENLKDKNVGLITCKSNVRHNTKQVDPNSPITDNIMEHRNYAKETWEKYKFETSEIDRASGFFMLVNKKAWSKAGGFPGIGIFNEDWAFCKRILNTGNKIFCMNGLYIYHARHRTDKWIENDLTTKDYRIPKS